MIKRLSLTLAAMVATFFVVIFSFKASFLLLVGFEIKTAANPIPVILVAAGGGCVAALVMYGGLENRKP